MRTVDKLIAKFIEAKEDLEKSTALNLDTKEDSEKATLMEKNDKGADTASPAEDLNKGYISPAYKYGPTKKLPKPVMPKPAVEAAPEKPKEEVDVKKDEGMEKGSFPNKAMQAQAMNDAFRASQIGKKPIATSHPATLPSPEEHAARQASFNDFMPPGKFTKTINNSYAPSPNSPLAQSEKISLAKNGQWSLDKADSHDCYACGKMHNDGPGMCDACKAKAKK